VRLLLLLTGLSQFVSCATGLLTVPLEDSWPVQAIPAAAGVRLVAPAGDSAILVSGPPDAWEARIVARVHGADAEELLALPEEQSQCGYDAERLVSRDDGSWWYSRCAGGVDRFFIRVVTSDAPSRAASWPVSIDPGAARGWLPMDGPRPEGLLLSNTTEGTVRADVVTAVGAEAVGTFTRNDARVITQQTWQAHRLDAARFAIVSVEFDDRTETSMILLRVFDAGELHETRLPFAPRRRYLSVASAADARGRLAVVAATAREAAAMLVDPAHADAGRARVVPGGDEISTSASAGVRMAVVGDRIVATWLRPGDHTVRLAELGEGFAYAPVTIGSAAEDSLLALTLSGENLDLFWASQSGVARRRLPDHPTGFVIASELWMTLRRTFASL
jgi:hypothetical protein